MGTNSFMLVLGLQSAASALKVVVVVLLHGDFADTDPLLTLVFPHAEVEDVLVFLANNEGAVVVVVAEVVVVADEG